MEEIAEVYSRALFEVAKEQGVLDRVHDELGQFADALGDSRDLQVFFFSPYFSSQEKKDGIAKLVEGADESFVRFLELLAERHRMPVVFRMRTELVEGIGKRIEEQTGERVELSSKVDPDVLGGLVLQVGNMVLDASVRNRLERLRKQVAKAA